MMRVLNSQRQKKKVTIKELLTLFPAYHSLPKLSDKALFILLAAEILHRHYDSLEASLRNFRLEICPIPKQVRVRTERDEDEVDRVRRRRPRRAQAEGAGRIDNLEEFIAS
ncbi:unnamed protein product [Sphagnum balticum]